jgi:hypothetical protein
MVFEFNLIAVKLMEDEPLVNLLQMYHVACSIAIY